LRPGEIEVFDPEEEEVDENIEREDV